MILPVGRLLQEKLGVSHKRAGIAGCLKQYVGEVSNHFKQNSITFLYESHVI